MPLQISPRDIRLAPRGGPEEPPAAGEGQGEGRAPGGRGAAGLLPRTISMILVFLPVFFFMVKMYCASTTPPTSAHTLALATAPILATAVLSMVGDPETPGAAAGKRGCALSAGDGAGSRRAPLSDRRAGNDSAARAPPSRPLAGRTTTQRKGGEKEWTGGWSWAPREQEVSLRGLEKKKHKLSNA